MKLTYWEVLTLITYCRFIVWDYEKNEPKACLRNRILEPIIDAMGLFCRNGEKMFQIDNLQRRGVD